VPVEIASGAMSSASKVNGEMKPTRMEFHHFARPMKGCMLRGQPGEYYSVDGYQQRNGIRAATGDAG
jgi:hypothetical protein